MRVTLQMGMILHSRPWRETSVLLEVFAREHGRVGLLARGVRASRSRWRGLMRPFLPVVLSWSGKGELCTVTGIEPVGLPLQLGGAVLSSGLYLNELLVRLLPRFDPCPNLFDVYQRTLQDLVTSTDMGFIERCLRIFEKQLLVELGYGFSLECEYGGQQLIQPQEYYHYLMGRGLVRAALSSAKGGAPLFLGQHLLALHHGILDNTETLSAAKRLMRQVFAGLLGAKPLRSRQLFCK